MKIAIVATGQSEEVVDLVTKIEKQKLEYEVLNVTDPNLETIDADVVYWRSASVTKHFKKAVGRTNVMERLQQKMPVINAALINSPHITNKSFQQTHLKNVLPQMRGIDSFLAKDTQALEQLFAEKKLVLPCIAKPDQGSQGNGVVLLESEADVAKLEKVSTFIFQNFIPNDCDYRIFVVGGVAIDVVRRRATSSSTKEYLNNMSQGGVAEKVDDGALYHQLAKKAERIAAAFDLTVCGVDLIQHSETGDVYFMEINTVPQWVVFGDALSVDIGEYVLEALVSAAKQNSFSVPAISTYFERHLSVMYPRKAFHYLSRMYLWTKDSQYKKQLDDIRLIWLPDASAQLKLAKKIPTLSVSAGSGGRKYRQACYQKHYKIYKYNLIFFKALFLKTIYDDALADEMIAALDVNDLQATREALLADKQAIYTLSTHAVNFLYHYAYFFNEPLHPKLFIEIGKECSLPDVSDNAEARSYMFTHAIIGASQFYATRPITQYLHVYIEMIREIEATILNNFTAIPLDVKCEFLVCAALLQYESNLKSAIKTEVEGSRSPHGDFIIDTLNEDKNMAYKKGFQNSEHRNVLAIMAFDDTAI